MKHVEAERQCTGGQTPLGLQDCRGHYMYTSESVAKHARGRGRVPGIAH